MTFDVEQAEDVLADRDRDATPFFAGREPEIENFESAFRELRRHPGGQAAFRIFQGPPGSGKTALLRRLEEKFGKNSLFVEIGPRHLVGEDVLTERMRTVAEKRVPGVRNLFAVAARGATEFLRMTKTADWVMDVLQKAKIERFVLVMDEAQRVGPAHQPGLQFLHSETLAKPTVCLFAGLSHAADTVRVHGGLSRLSRKAVSNLGRLPDEACAESTRKMLESFDARGDAERAAEAVAEMSLGWPQHLKCAQQALCGELLAVDGDLRRVDYDVVRRETDDARREYYAERLRNTVLGRHVPFAASVALEARRRGPMQRLDLEKLCESGLTELRREYPGFDPTGEDYANALIEKGVLARRDDDRFEISIPSMADWLAEELERHWPTRIPDPCGIGR